MKSFFNPVKKKPFVVGRPKPLFQPVKLPTRKSVKTISKKNLTWPQAVVKYPKVTMFGDADKDGKLNMFDCKPFDKKRHGYTRNQNIINKRMKALNTEKKLTDVRWVLSDGTRVGTNRSHNQIAGNIIKIKPGAKRGTGKLGGNNISDIAAMQGGAGAIRTSVSWSGGGVNVSVLSKQKITEEQKRTLREIKEESESEGKRECFKWSPLHSFGKIYYDIEPDEVGPPGYKGESGSTDDMDDVFEKHEEYYKRSKVHPEPEVLNYLHEDYNEED